MPQLAISKPLFISYMSIIEAKKQLSDAIAKFEHLKTELDNKSNLGFYSEQEWHKHLKDLGLEAAQLIQTTRNFDDNLIDLLNRKQQKLKRHSIWKKKHKKRIQQRKRHQAKKHEKWIKDIEWKVTMSSSVNATTVAAASVNNFSSLYTDNKQAQQQADDKKQIKILTKKLALLTNIRNLRRKKLEAKGHFFADEGDKFFNKVKQWHEDNKSTQSDSSQQDQQQVAVRNEGLIHPKDTWHNMAIDEAAYSYWCGANQSLDTLLNTRRLWDQYILLDNQEHDTPHKVPPTYVAPVPPANAIWASYLL